MFSNCKPTWMIEAICQITPTQLKSLDTRAVSTNLDNTLIAWNSLGGVEELFIWILETRNAGIPAVAVSNNDSKRIARAVEKSDLLYVARAMKPPTRGINIAKKQLDLAGDKVVMIGDQIITDIRGASRVGACSILVKPIITINSWRAQFNCFWEKRIMAYLLAKHPDMSWRGGIE